jgi:hypothetical protein
MAARLFGQRNERDGDAALGAAAVLFALYLGSSAAGRVRQHEARLLERPGLTRFGLKPEAGRQHRFGGAVAQAYDER